MAFVLPQFGIFAQGTHAHHFLEFDLAPGVTADEAVDGVPSLAHAGRVGRRRQPGRRRSAPMRGAASLRSRHRRTSRRFEPVAGRRRPTRAGHPARRVAVDQRRRARRHLAERPRRGRGGRPAVAVAAEQHGLHLSRRPRHHRFRRRHGEPPVRAGRPTSRSFPPGRPARAEATCSRCVGCTISRPSTSSRSRSSSA